MVEGLFGTLVLPILILIPMATESDVEGYDPKPDPGPSVKPIGSWTYMKYEDCDLQFIQKVADESKRRVIPSTYHERLAVYRNFVTLPTIVDHYGQQYQEYNRLLWNNCATGLFKSLPSLYIHLFMSCYAPEDHLFISKMCPIWIGNKWAKIVTTMLHLTKLADMLARYLDFIKIGIKYNLPWNTCLNSTITKIPTETCATAEKIRQLIREGKVDAQFAYVNTTGPDNDTDPPIIGMPMISFYRARILPMYFENDPGYFHWYMIIFFVLSFLCHKQLYRRYIFKFHFIIHWALNTVYFIIVCHLLYVKMEVKMPPAFKPLLRYNEELRNTFVNVDLYIVAESFTSPGIVHLFSSRSRDKVNPGVDSVIILLSNYALYLGKVVVGMAVRHFCVSKTGLTIRGGLTNAFPILFLYGIYFSYYPFGDFLYLIFLTLNMINEFNLFVIIYQSLVEIFVTEWPIFASKQIYSLGLSFIFLILGCLCCVYVTNWLKMTLVLYSVVVTTAMEVIIIFLFYPMGRFTDDVFFTTGRCMPYLRLWTLRIMPVFYMFKLITVLQNYKVIRELFYATTARVGYDFKFLLHSVWFPTWFLVPYALGILYVLVYLLVRKGDWRTLFRPVKTWGPRDPVVRQLRKEFDSRRFITSQSLRGLSRHIMSQCLSNTYKLGICYEKPSQKQRISLAPNKETDKLSYADEKKKV